jgi:folate-dependent phosphoribosylglycinamide formyltransferase PurN
MKLSPGDRPAELGGKTSARRFSRRRASTRAHVQALLGAGVDVRAMSHITGGGLPGNLPRVLPEGLGVASSRPGPARPSSTSFSAPGIDEPRCAAPFNVGVGFVFVVAPPTRARASRLSAASARGPSSLGTRRAVPADRRSRSAWSGRSDRARRARLGQRDEPASHPRRRRRRTLDARVAVVVSNVAGAPAPRARARKRASRRSSSITRRSRPALVRRGARRGAARARRRVVVLAGFMRLVTDVLLDAFPMRVVNVHPALSPRSRASRAAAGARLRRARRRVHGAPRRRGTDTGPILAQAAVPVLEDDDERVAARAHPRARARAPAAGAAVDRRGPRRRSTRRSPGAGRACAFRARGHLGLA